MSDPLDALLSSRRPLVLGIGGGGDVVGALATAEWLRTHRGAQPVLGGVSWERMPIDPEPGPRAASQIEGARPIAPCVLAAGPATRARGSGVRFAESRVAALLGEETVLVDGSCGPATIARGLRTASAELGCDAIGFIDVGGDVLAHGDEAGLGSPLCDSIMLAAAVRIQERGDVPVVGGVFGAGCDGELTPAEVSERLEELAAAGGLAKTTLEIDDAVAAALDRAIAVVPTEASAQALRAHRGEVGIVAIRGGRRSVELTPLAARTFFFDPRTALRSIAHLAAAVIDADDLEEANELLRARGIRTELDHEREVGRASP